MRAWLRDILVATLCAAPFQIPLLALTDLSLWKWALITSGHIVSMEAMVAWRKHQTEERD